MTKNDCNCFPKVQEKARTPELTTPAAMSSVEPPDTSILRDCSQLDFYISALERWATIAKASGVAETLLADIILAHGVEQAPELCKEMSDHFDKLLKGNSKGVEKIVTWLKAKFGMNKHADMVKVLNLFLNTTRSRSENLVEYITRFERNYAEVKK